MRVRIILILLLIFSLQIALRLPYLNEPLERDEGAYAYVAQRILAGELPYRDAYDNKPPGVYYIYAGVFKVFGDTFSVLRNFTLFFSLLITLSVFAVGYLIWGGAGGLISAFLYALFSGGPYVQGTSANTETFMVFPLILALFFFMLAVKKPADKLNLLIAGFFSGMALMIKQAAVFNFLALLLFSFVLPGQDLKGRVKSGMVLFLGFMIAPVVFLLYFWLKGALPDLLKAAILDNLNFVGGRAWHWSYVPTILLRENSILWILAISSAVYIFCQDRKFELLVLAGWAIFSLAGVFAGKSFFGHYFIQVIPGLAILSSYAITRFFDKPPDFLSRSIIYLSFFVLMLIILSFQIDFLLSSPDEISLKKYGIPNFVIAKPVADYIKSNTRPEDSIYVWGAEGEIYFYARRKSASKYFYYYQLEKSEQLRLWLMEDLRRNEPKYLIWTNPAAGFAELSNHVSLNYGKDKSFGIWQIWKRKK